MIPGWLFYTIGFGAMAGLFLYASIQYRKEHGKWPW